MRALDTNVLARWLLYDDPVQSAIAQRAVSEPFWVSQTVLLELGWVLFKALKLPRATVAGMLRQIVDLDAAEVENDAALVWAIERFERGADWADVVHIAACASEVVEFVTFDRALARKAGKGAPVQVVQFG